MDLSNLLKRLEHDSLIILDCFECNCMKMNEDNCNFLIAGNKYEHLWARVGHSQILESQSEKILGVTIDRNLKFEEHVKHILVSAGKNVKCSG